jgi:hypothetical protein
MVFSSMYRAPHSHAATILSVSWVCGPAATPSGVARNRPYLENPKGSLGSGRKNKLPGIPKKRFCLISESVKCRIAGSGTVVKFPDTIKIFIQLNEQAQN